MIPHVGEAAIRHAMRRFDRDLRATPKWSNWQENKSHKFAIVHDGSRYPVKQIVSMATGMPVSNFSGGTERQQANAYVRERGFQVIQIRSRNPNWTRDELILALDLYLQHRDAPPGKTSAEITALSDTLNDLAAQLGTSRGERFRNANGVYMKLMNFRSLDPEYTSGGKVGMQHGGKDDEAVWREFADDPERCHRVAQQIRRALELSEVERTADADVDDMEVMVTVTSHVAGPTPWGTDACAVALTCCFHLWSRFRLRVWADTGGPLIVNSNGSTCCLCPIFEATNLRSPFA